MQLLEQRLARARRLLATPGNQSNKSVVLAFAAGFGDPSYFSRVSRKTFGITPSEWLTLQRHSSLASGQAAAGFVPPRQTNVRPVQDFCRQRSYFPASWRLPARIAPDVSAGP
ncbi:MAG: helix-turn-helix domain-containing protein [Acidobacteriota bacterium]